MLCLWSRQREYSHWWEYGLTGGRQHALPDLQGSGLIRLWRYSPGLNVGFCLPRERRSDLPVLRRRGLLRYLVGGWLFPRGGSASLG